METIKSFGCILSGWVESTSVRQCRNAASGMVRTDVRVEKNADSTGVHVLELGQVIDLTVNYDPLSSGCV